MLARRLTQLALVAIISLVISVDEGRAENNDINSWSTWPAVNVC